MGNMKIPPELMQELEKQFIDDIGFLLDDCEESFLNLDVESRRPEELAKIFRVAHSIKGSADAIGLTSIAEFAHKVEDCLAILREKPQLVFPMVISLLLQAGDEFRKYIALLREQKHSQWAADELKLQIVDLNAILQSPDPAAALGTATPPVPAVPTQGEIAAPVVAETSAKELPQNVIPFNDPPPKEVPRKEISPKEIPGKDLAPASSNTAIKLDSSRIDTVLNLVGELVVIKSQMLQAFFDAGSSNTQENALLTLFEKTVRELQDQALTMRMTAIKPVFVRVQRIMRDLSLKLEKPIDVIMEGEDLEVDRSMIDLLTDPLIHIVRNSLDHGIEPAPVRQAKGKPKTGTIRLCTKQAGGRIVIEISDDGAGVSRDKVLQRAIERELVRPGVNPQTLSDAEVYDFLFMPGFSTAEKVTELSGRGVGLDVVKSNVHKMKGTIELLSTHGKGTLFRISLPLTTAITDGVVAVVENLRVILPIDEILEIIDIRGKSLTRICDRHQIIKVRDSLIPIFRIEDVLKHSSIELKDYQMWDSAEAQKLAESSQSGSLRKSETVMIMRGAGEPFGIIVTAVIGQSQVVVKPLGPTFESGNGLSGVAILGDGRLGLVLDVGRVAQLVLKQNILDPSHSNEKREENLKDEAQSA